jgi:hypothetical protein
MSIPNIFRPSTLVGIKERINALSPQNQPAWGSMTASQMLAHLNVMFELALEDKHPRPGFLMRTLLSAVAKKQVVSEKPYPKNGRTAPEMVIKGKPDFEVEKTRLLAYLDQIAQKGEAGFDQHPHPVFGKLSATEWSNTFHKHINHHLSQFSL